MVLAAIVIAWYAIQSGGDNVQVSYVSEQIGESAELADWCDWQVIVEIENRTDFDLTLVRARVIVERRQLTAIQVGGPERVPAGGAAQLSVEARVAKDDSGRCPATDAIDHELLRIRLLSDGTGDTIERSLRF